jgi:hypothetical protein
MQVLQLPGDARVRVHRTILQQCQRYTILHLPNLFDGMSPDALQVQHVQHSVGIRWNHPTRLY